jgi:uncharacterized protein (TIGR03435 family)
MNHRICNLLLTAATCVGAAALAQSQPPAARPSFEVASIKPNNSSDHRAMFRMLPGGKMSVANISAQMLITMAFDLKPNQLSGAPGWLESEKYDIEAKSDGPASPDQMKLMVQSLLQDRFKLSSHRETKEMAIYALVASKNGSKLHPAAESGEGKSQFRIGRGQLNLQSATMAQLADALSRVVGRNVLDRTGITGSFDIKLEWTPDQNEGGGPRGPEGPKEGGDTAPVGDSGPSIFTAIQEQLGLKLDGQKGPVEMLVIDHVEKPSEN